MKFNLNNTVGNILKGHSVKSSVISGLASSGLSGPFRAAALAFLGKKTSADVYITEIETGEKTQLAYVPESIQAKASGRFQSYSIIEKGEVKVPKGENLTSVAWEAILPGESLLDYPFIKRAAWEKPDEIIRRLEKWKSEGTKLNLLVTQTAINLDVYLQDFTNEPEGAMGNIRYSISFVAAKDIFVKTVEEADSERTEGEESADENAPELNSRPSLPQKSTTPFGISDNLWEIAQYALGDGAKWAELAAMNRSVIDDVENIAANTVLKLR